VTLAQVAATIMANGEFDYLAGLDAAGPMMPQE
jgi:hypothetical protein